MASTTTKKVQFKPKAAQVEGKDFTVAPVKDARTATEAVLSIVLAHTADVFHAVVDAVAEHYSLDKAEMMEVITTHPKYVGVTLHPVLADLGAFDKPAEAAVASVAEPAKKKKFVIRKKEVAEPSA